MARPQKHRIVGFNPNTRYFKPRGIPMGELAKIRLTLDEFEAIRLADLQGLSHAQAGNKMGVSRATFSRIIQNARKTIADALINGKAISIEGGNYKIICSDRTFICADCDNRWEETSGTGRPAGCPFCHSPNIGRISK
ncbi:MAG: DUF134 domain-containing protein [Desulfobacterales bacterium]|nr:DUF134 domain-containing protein [Desulfobacterales bacterium]